MAIQLINVGTSPNDGTGDTPRAVGQKLNSNFSDTGNAASKLVVSSQTDATADRVLTTGYSVKALSDVHNATVSGHLMSVGGSADAIDLTSFYTAPANQYVVGAEYEFVAIANSTISNPTVSIDGLAAITVNGFIVSGDRYRIKYNGISFDILFGETDTEATPNTIALRNAGGTFKVGTPTDPAHPITRGLGAVLGGAPVIITESGTYEPSSGTVAIIVEVQGAGGAGASCGSTGSGEGSHSGSGQGGSYALKYIPVTNWQAYSATVTVGAGAPKPAAGTNNGGNGGSTIYADGSITITAPGGTGGQTREASSNTGVGASLYDVPSPPATGGDINAQGENPVPSTSAGARGTQGKGGSSKFGAGGYGNAQTGASSGIDGSDATGYGAAGSGAVNGNNQPARQGGAGADGIVIIWEFK